MYYKHNRMIFNNQKATNNYIIKYDMHNTNRTKSTHMNKKERNAEIGTAFVWRKIKHFIFANWKISRKKST